MFDKGKVSRMSRLNLFAFVVFGMAGTSTFAQQTTPNENWQLVDQLNHISQTLAGVRAIASRLELGETQQEQLNELQQEMNRITQSIGKLESEKVDGNGLSNDELFTILKRNREVHERLFDEILLPHQADILKRYVFEGQVRASGGNVFSTVLRFYNSEFLFSVDQQRKLETMQESASAQIKAAQEEFRKKLEEIGADSLRKLNEVLNHEQKSQLKRLMPRQNESK